MRANVARSFDKSAPRSSRFQADFVLRPPLRIATPRVRM